jgi:hypothetical protein
MFLMNTPALQSHIQDWRAAAKTHRESAEKYRGRDRFLGKAEAYEACADALERALLTAQPAEGVMVPRDEYEKLRRDSEDCDYMQEIGRQVGPHRASEFILQNKLLLDGTKPTTPTAPPAAARSEEQNGR